MEEDYIKNLNKGSIYRNDLIIAENEFRKVEEWNMDETFEKVLGGFIGILAPTGSGKSYLLRDILSKIHKNYENIYLMCPTAKFQTVYDYFPDKNIIDHFDEEFLVNLFDERTKKFERSKKEKKEVKKVMVILDDVVSDKEYTRSKIMDKLSISARPVGITIVILSQYFSRIKPMHRTNLRLFIGFDVDNMNELEKFTSESMCNINKRVGRLLYKKITGEKKYQVCIVELYKLSVPMNEKVRKYTSRLDVPKFKIKEIVAEKETGNLGYSLPKCSEEINYLGF